MKTVSKNNIIDLYVWLDDHLIKQAKTGRPPALSDSELLTIPIFSSLTENHQRLSEVYAWVKRFYPGWFVLPAYANFVAGVHRALPVMIALLKSLLAERAPLRFADSTMIPVCRQVRSKSHKVAKGLAAWGKNHQDWFYGFKLHISIDHLNRICAAIFKPG